MRKLAVSLILGLAISAPVYANDKSVKVEAGPGLITYGDSGAIGLQGRANVTIPIVDRAFDIGFEVEGSTAIDKIEEGFPQILEIDGEEREVFTFLEDFGVQEHMAGYFIFRVPLESGLGVSVRAGYHKSNYGGRRIVEIPATEFTDTETFDLDFEGPAAGLGVEYFFGNKKNGVRFDITWHDVSDLDISGGSTWSTLSYMRRF